MNLLTSVKRCLAVGLFALSLFMTACGAEPGVKLNNQGNEAFAREAYLEALNLYQNAQTDNPELAEAYYNAANAFYREGQYDQALAQMQHALLHADVDLAQHSYFNLGNSFFQAEDLETAVQSYIEALLLNPDDADAKYNLELALIQQQQQQEEQQQEQNQEENQEQQEQTGGAGEEEEENQEQQDQTEENQNGEQHDQKQEGEQSEEDQETEPENQGQHGEQDGQESEEAAAESDQTQPGQNGEEEEQQKHGQAGQPGEPGGQENGLAGLQPGEKLSEDQAIQLLAAIANNSQTLQEKLGQILIVPGPPPAQDW